MKDNQTVKKELTRSSDLGNRRSKESQLKNNRKTAKKNLSAVFTMVPEDASTEISKEPIDSCPISEISDINSEDETVESFVQDWSPPETFRLSDLSPCSMITTKDGPAGIPVERNRLNSLSDSKIRPVKAEIYELYERDCLAELVSAKVRVLFLCLLLWILVVSMIFFFKSGPRSTSAGPLPT